jgi:hypothetical protein
MTMSRRPKPHEVTCLRRLDEGELAPGGVHRVPVDRALAVVDVDPLDGLAGADRPGGLLDARHSGCVAAGRRAASEQGERERCSERRGVKAHDLLLAAAEGSDAQPIARAAASREVTSGKSGWLVRGSAVVIRSPPWGDSAGWPRPCGCSWRWRSRRRRWGGSTATAVGRTPRARTGASTIAGTIASAVATTTSTTATATTTAVTDAAARSEGGS